MNQLIRLILLRLSAPATWRRLIVTFLFITGLAWTCMTGIALASELLGMRGELLGMISTFAQSATTDSPALRTSPQNLTKNESIQPYFERVSKELTEFRLENGMKFIVLERHQAPVVSFLTYADVGGVNEPKGKTGVAHFLEHLAFEISQLGLIQAHYVFTLYLLPTKPNSKWLLSFIIIIILLPQHSTLMISHLLTCAVFVQ